MGGSSIISQTSRMASQSSFFCKRTLFLPDSFAPVLPGHNSYVNLLPCILLKIYLGTPLVCLSHCHCQWFAAYCGFVLSFANSIPRLTISCKARSISQALTQFCIRASGSVRVHDLVIATHHSQLTWLVQLITISYVA
jgi:hypothetical protein